MSLPSNFVVRLNESTQVIDDGAALVGGSPARYVRLSAAARECLNLREVVASNPTATSLAEKLLDMGMADPVVDLLDDLSAEYTVVIPVYNRADQLARLLASVRDATAGATSKPRVIVVDDCSADPQSIAQVAQSFGAECIALTKNQGPAAARNAGLAQVTTEYVVFLDSDIVVDAHTIPTLLKHFADPKVAIVAPRISGLLGQPGWIARYEDVASSLDLGPVAASIKPRTNHSWIPAAAIAARVAAVSSGFDTDMQVGEDVDLVWRLSKAGWRIRYEPSATARHEHRADLRQWAKRKQDYGTSAVALAKKHPEAIAPAILAPWGVGVMVALLVQRKWSVPVAIVIGVLVALRGRRQFASAKYPFALSASLTARGFEAAFSQVSALMLRHWWPVTFFGCLFSQRIRKATLALALIDIGREYVRRSPRMDPVSFGAARRLDDIAYGSGVWLASLRARTISALKIQIVWPKK
jgi:mycofactocin system glycosyltransferase